MNTIIEKIRAEVERLKETAKLMKLSTYKSGWNSAMNAVLQLLSTLEKDEKPMNSNEGLEEEFIRYIHEKDAEVSERGESTYAQEDLEDIARHFAQWGAEHRGCLEIPNDLEEAAEISFDEARALTEGYLYFLAKGLKENHPRPIGPHWFCKYAKNRFIAGAKWQKEQMMNGAVEGTVMDFSSNRPRPQVDVLLDPYKYHTGDKVHAIIVKEEGK